MAKQKKLKLKELILKMQEQKPKLKKILHEISTLYEDSLGTSDLTLDILNKEMTDRREIILELLKETNANPNKTCTEMISSVRSFIDKRYHGKINDFMAQQEELLNNMITKQQELNDVVTSLIKKNNEENKNG